MAAFDHNVKKVQAIIYGEMDSRETAKEKLLVYVHVYSNFLKYPFPQGGCPILNTAIEADDTHPHLKKKVADVINTWKSKIATLLQQGIDNKEFKPSIDPEQTAVAIIAMIEGSIMIAKVTGKMNYRNAVAQSVGLLIDSLS